MADFNIRSDSVNVEQIMRQIRARVREKRGVDYTEQQIRELAAVKLERFLDPTKVRSELMQQFREGGIAPLPNYGFEDHTLFDSTHAWLRWLRHLFRPILKLIVNLNPAIHALHTQAALNERQAQYTEMSYEILHNLVVEVTRLSIEVKNLKMRVESLSSRLDFGERRARALESVVQYRPGEVAEEAPAGEQGSGREPKAEGGDAPAGAPATEPRRRRRRRRGRRGGAARPGAPEETAQTDAADENGGEDEGEPDTPSADAAPRPVEDSSAREASPRASQEAPDNGHENQ